MSDKENERIEDMHDKLVGVLKTDKVWVGASAMICLLIESAQSSGTTKELWLNELSGAWDHYMVERGKDELV